jgi:Family of unknown function (DUF6364)
MGSTDQVLRFTRTFPKIAELQLSEKWVRRQPEFCLQRWILCFGKTGEICRSAYRVDFAAASQRHRMSSKARLYVLVQHSDDVRSALAIRHVVWKPTHPMTHPTKLTLRLDSGLIENAKAFAHDHQRSVSQLVADYFGRLADQPEAVGSAKSKASSRASASLAGSSVIGRVAELSPVTTSLRGVLKAKSAPKSSTKHKLNADPDKAAYRKHLEAKHL